MSKLVVVSLVLIYFFIDTIFRLSDINFSQSDIKNKARFDNKVILKPKDNTINYRSDIFPVKSGEFNHPQKNSTLLSLDTITFDQTEIKLLAISFKNDELFATFKASQENPIEGFGHYHHARKGESILGAKLVNITANTIVMQVKEQQFTLKLFNPGESNAIK